MSVPSIIFDVVNFAINVHDGQKRKGNESCPYVCHPIRVAQIIAKEKPPTSIIIAALLHDVVEDTNYTLDDIRTLLENLNWRLTSDFILEIVNDLTLKDDEEKIEAIERLGNKKVSNYTIVIKMADMIDNYKNSNTEKINKNRDRAKLLKEIAFKRELNYSICFCNIYSEFCSIFNI